VKFAAHLWPQNTTWEAIRDAALVADRVGFEMVTIWDHFYALSGKEERSNLESHSVLAALAAVTTRIRLAPLVQSVTYRHPAVIANIAATQDQISHGRTICGIGAGWNQTEHRAYGIDLGTPGERSRRLSEAAKIIRKLLDGERVTYDGRFFHLKDAVLNTRPVQTRLPILVGGGGEQKTLRTAGRYADLWHAFGNAEVMKRKIDILRTHSVEAGRDADAVEPWGGQWVCVRDDPEEARQVLDEIRTHHPDWAGPNAIVGNPDQVAVKIKELWDVGVRGFIIGFGHPFDVETIERVAKEVRPRLDQLVGRRSDAAAS
jgi:alkanesulfonate monooxygenase SsuD/methylene tetrahydromethanopterin reductase-like flavin-dependent oxidoreductase (luciferase family)